MLAGKNIRYAPLLLIERKVSPIFWASRSRSVLYFGRLDTEKYFNEFKVLSIDKEIVATMNLNIRSYSGEITKLSISEKDQLFQLYRFIWCVQRSYVTQSAVVLEALKFRCVVILSADDPLCGLLDSSEFIALNGPEEFELLENKIDNYSINFPDGPTGVSFSSISGKKAFDNYYTSIFL